MKRSNFDIRQWLSDRGLNKTLAPDNKRQTLLNLEDQYSVPKLKFVDKYGVVTIDFSSPL